EGGYGRELAPLTIAPAGLSGAEWASLQPAAQAASTSTVFVAYLRIQGSNASANLREISAAGIRDHGTVSAAIGGTDPASLRAALTALSLAINTAIQDDWKAHMQTSTTASARSRISASALYANERDWQRIKSALEGAAATVVSDIRIEAVSRQGAL